MTITAVREGKPPIFSEILMAIPTTVAKREAPPRCAVGWRIPRAVCLFGAANSGCRAQADISERMALCDRTRRFHPRAGRWHTAPLQTWTGAFITAVVARTTGSAPPP